MSMRIGVDNLVYALMTAEDTATTAPTYGTVKKALGVQSLSVNPNGSNDTAFGDDGPYESASTLGKIEVEIKKAELSTQEKADLLGHEIDANGGIAYSSNDTPPYVAVGYRTLKANGKYRYYWLYKMKFIDPEEQNETKGDSINFQSDTIKGSGVKLNNEITINGKKKKVWKYDLDEEHTTANPIAITKWFDDVMFPSMTVVTA